MTVSTTNNRDTYAGNGSTTAFATTFAYEDDTDLLVTLVVDATGVETVQTITTEYTATSPGGATGTVTMVTAPASGETLVVERNLPYTQATDYTPNDPFPAETHEAALDKLTYLIQQLKDLTDRAVTLSITTSLSGLTIPDPGAGEYLKYNEAGTDLETGSLSALSATPVSLTSVAAWDLLRYESGGAEFVNVNLKDFADQFHTNSVKQVQLVYKNPDTDIEVADGLMYFAVPADLAGYNLIAVQGNLVTAGVGTTVPTFQIHNVTDAVDMLSTKLTFDSTEKDTSTATTAAVINTANDDVADGDQLRIDCDVVGSTTAGAGLIITLKFEKP